MAKRPLTKAQKQTRNICLAFVLIFVLVGVGANLIISNEYGMYLQIGAPEHDSPLSCAQEEYLQCTTKEGKCTKQQDRCAYPETNDDCSIVMYKEQLSKDEKKALKSRYPDDLARLQKIKIVEQYCANEKIHLYSALSDDISIWTIIFELILSIALFALFFSEIVKVSHDLAYN